VVTSEDFLAFLFSFFFAALLLAAADEDASAPSHKHGPSSATPQRTGQASRSSSQVRLHHHHHHHSVGHQHFIHAVTASAVVHFHAVLYLCISAFTAQYGDHLKDLALGTSGCFAVPTADVPEGKGLCTLQQKSREKAIPSLLESGMLAARLVECSPL
jgi:hypothetical protein